MAFKTTMPIVDYRDMLGKPFKFGATGPNAYDCWGVVVEVYRRLGVDISLPIDYDDDPRQGADVFSQYRADVWHPVEGTHRPYDVLTFTRDGIDAAVHCGVSVPFSHVLQATEKHGVIAVQFRFQKAKFLKAYRHECHM